MDGCAPEREVMRNNYASLRHGAFKHVFVSSTDEFLVSGCADVAAAIPKTGDNIRSDVLISEKGELERPHAVILNSQVCSPLSA